VSSLELLIKKCIQEGQESRHVQLMAVGKPGGSESVVGIIAGAVVLVAQRQSLPVIGLLA
jgi:hypothetical protein